MVFANPPLYRVTVLPTSFLFKFPKTLISGWGRRCFAFSLRAPNFFLAHIQKNVFSSCPEKEVICVLPSDRNKVNFCTEDQGPILRMNQIICP